MAGGFFVTPRQGAYRLSNAAIPAVLLAEEIAGADADGVVRAELTIDNGNITGIAGITGITSAASGHSRTPVIDLDGGMLWPCLVDMHTHLDKGHIWPRAPNPDGTFDGALNATDRDRTAHWSAEDVHARMEFALRCAYAHGTALIRTHLDSIAPQHA
ncbi:MAG: cytosine deaminase, partial [Alphaproteobacteria bacterium]